MLNFNRVAQVIAGPYGQEGVLITGLDVSFSVVKTDDPKVNTMEVRVYNAAPNTRQLLETTENTVIVNAGYFGNVRQLAAGDITKGSTVMSGVDRVTSALCGDGLRALSTKRVSLSYDGAVSARQIINDISTALGLEVQETDADLSGKFRTGWAFVGPAKDAMTSIAKRFGLDWSVQNEEIQVTTRRGVNTKEAVLITPETGLIGHPAPLDDARDDNVDAKEPPGLRIMTLLNPLYVPGGVVVLRSKGYDDAEFRIKRVEHDGDTRGSAWHSTLEVVER